MAIVVKRNMTIGAISAEEDTYFLDRCFVETDHSAQLADARNPKCIALGRTGSGKSAALIRIKEGKLNSVQIDPEALSLNYISNSTIIKYLDGLGINLDIFYQLLWRHVIVVELLKLKKHFHDEISANRWLANILDSLKPNRKRQAALQYLQKFGSSFWLDTEARVREVVQNIESSIESKVGFKLDSYFMSPEFQSGSSMREDKQVVTEIINKAQQAVNSVQLQELNEVIEFLSEDVFNDRQQIYYLIIDDLDTNWVHDSIRFKLIRALIETIKKFRKVLNVKIIISLRADLLETVIANTSERGFQTEKYEDMMLRIDWTKSELYAVMNSRINQLFRDKYTNKDIAFEDVFPGKIGDVDVFTYMLDRTLFRPRDLIVFVNECFNSADSGATSIGTKTVRNAEIAYSRKRMRSLADEWRSVYGDLETPLKVLSKLEVRFSAKDLTDKMLEDLCIEIIAGDVLEQGRFSSICHSISSNNGMNYSALRKFFIEAMYVVGAIGYRRFSGNPFEWSFRNEPTLNFSAVGEDSLFAIHPMLHREFNIRSDATSLLS